MTIQLPGLFMGSSDWKWLGRGCFFSSILATRFLLQREGGRCLVPRSSQVTPQKHGVHVACRELIVYAFSFLSECWSDCSRGSDIFQIPNDTTSATQGPRLSWSKSNLRGRNAFCRKLLGPHHEYPVHLREDLCLKPGSM